MSWENAGNAMRQKFIEKLRADAAQALDKSVQWHSFCDEIVDKDLKEMCRRVAAQWNTIASQFLDDALELMGKQ